MQSNRIELLFVAPSKILPNAERGIDKEWIEGWCKSALDSPAAKFHQEEAERAFEKDAHLKWLLFLTCTLWIKYIFKACKLAEEAKLLNFHSNTP